MSTDVTPNFKHSCEIVGLSDNAISDIERAYRLTTMEKLNALANYFEVSVDYLMGRTDNPKINK